MTKTLRTALAAIVTTVVLASCQNGTSPMAMPTPTNSATATPGSGLAVGTVGTAVYRDRVGVASLITNNAARGIRDIELTVEFFAGETPVLTVIDVLAFCPSGASCPWATAAGVTEEGHRSIDSAKVRITRTGPIFDAGVIRPIDLRISRGSMSFDLPARPGVAILYVVEDDMPYFGMFTSHQSADATTLRFTESDLPIGPVTRGVFYEGHVPESMIAGGD